MGLNICLHIFEKKENETSATFLEYLFSKLSFIVVEKTGGKDWFQTKSFLYRDSKGEYVGIGVENNFIVILDRTYSLMTYDRPTKIKEISIETGNIVFTMGQSDTVGIQFYSFIKDGNDVRNYSNDEGKVEENGEALIYDKETNDAFEVMANYALSYSKFDSLSWTINKLKDLKIK